MSEDIQDDLDPVDGPVSEDEQDARPVGPLGVAMPAATHIVREARRLAGDKNIRVTDIATCVAQDPVLILELLRVANSIHFIQDRPPITTAQTAVVHLGSTQVTQIIDSVSERAGLEDKTVFEVFETLRFQTLRISIVARILANATRKDLASEAQTTALLSNLGHMMACQYFGHEYVSLSRELNRSSLVYRLKSNYNFDIAEMQLAYLRQHGFPEVLAFALDRDMTCKTPWRQPLRYLVQSAIEFVEAYDSDKWDRFKPGARISSKSAVRLLQLKDDQYEVVWERCNDYLQSFTDVPALTIASEAAEAAEGSDDETVGIRIDGAESEEEPALSNPLLDDEITLVEPVLEEDITGGSITAFMFANLPEPEFEEYEDFSLENPPDDFRYSRQAQWVIDEFGDLFQEGEDPYRVLEDIMQRLIVRGPFVRASILELSEDRRQAKILAGVGEEMSAGNEIYFKDPLSPVAGCRTQVKSFNATDIPQSTAPFGITSYAVSPVNIENKTPIFLYADCGHNDSMPFEARRVFRYLVAMINNIMPNISAAA